MDGDDSVAGADVDSAVGAGWVLAIGTQVEVFGTLGGGCSG